MPTYLEGVEGDTEVPYTIYLKRKAQDGTAEAIDISNCTLSMVWVNYNGSNSITVSGEVVSGADGEAKFTVGTIPIAGDYAGEVRIVKGSYHETMERLLVHIIEQL